MGRKQGRQERDKKGREKDNKPTENKSLKTQNTKEKGVLNFLIATAFPGSMIPVLGFHFGESVPIVPVQSQGRAFSNHSVSGSQGTVCGLETTDL